MRALGELLADLYSTGLTVEQQTLLAQILVSMPTSTAKPGRQRTAECRERKKQNLDAGNECNAVTLHVTYPSPLDGPPSPITLTPPLSPQPNISIISEVDPNSCDALIHPEGTKPKRSPTLLAPLFEEFWEAYPRKVGKGAARRAFKTAMGKATREVILAGVNRLVASKPDPQFIPHPATWLNQERWLDEPEAKATRTVVPGPWKVFDPVKEEEKFKGLTAEERQRRIDKAANITQLLRQSLNRADPPCDVEVNPS